MGLDQRWRGALLLGVVLLQQIQLSTLHTSCVFDAAAAPYGLMRELVTMVYVVPLSCHARLYKYVWWVKAVCLLACTVCP